VLPSRQILFAILCGMVSAAVSVAQTPVSFKAVTSNNSPNSTTGGAPADIYSADLNNDGIPDIIQDVGASLGNFAVSIANGDGTFRAPVYYPYPAGISSQLPHAAMAFGDFNGDGNVDLVAAFLGTKILAVFLGNGNGTLQAPQLYSLGLSGADTIAACQVVAADFNHDGKVDLVLSGQAGTVAGSTARLYVLPGNGDGTFSAAQMIYSPSFPESAMTQVATGDFDGDGNADIGFVELFSTDNTHKFMYILALYGDGHMGFGNAQIVAGALVSKPGGLILGVGDLNGDGLTDMIAFEPGNLPPFLITAYGHAGRSWTSNTYFLGIPYTHYGAGSGLAPQIAVADFNDDGNTDIAIPATLAGAHYWMFFLRNGSRGEFTTRTWNLSPYANESNPVVGNFNRDGKPDLALVQYNSPGQSTITTELNYVARGVWSNCTYPLQGRGITLCGPTPSADGSIKSPVSFNAAASSFGQLRKIELWVDGNQLSQQSNVWENNAFLDFTAAFTPGAHQGKILASDVDSTVQQLDFSFTVGASNCTPPTTDSVRICSVVPSSAGVLVQASATVSGTLARMELWANGTKEFTETTSNNLSASIGLKAGTHKLTVVAANTNGAEWIQTVSVTVP
jgi:hypothetical protein